MIDSLDFKYSIKSMNIETCISINFCDSGKTENETGFI